MIKIPKLKKKVSSFLTKEDGKISKEKLIKAGVLLSAVAIASLKSVEADYVHKNNLTLSHSGTTVTGSHDNHSSHSSSGHGSGGWC